ncbi:g-box-binding factor 3-related [Anaeramoeba flamelloides]|uniref:G-box-binding factor 3-related n=1 Tax=Anaeramoeba flamelloides TaxID=1746091 RepID=A0ABQ8XWC1_9EUKA|nr:g-box-binding factor 3-related [Anaeramoeba flamelloides]
MEHSFLGLEKQKNSEIHGIELDPNFRTTNSNQDHSENTNEQSFLSSSPIVEQQFSVPYQRSSPISPMSEKIEYSTISQEEITLNEIGNTNQPTNTKTKDITNNNNNNNNDNDNDNNNNNKNTTQIRRSTRSSTRRNQINTRSTTRNQKKNNLRDDLYGTEPTKKIKRSQSGKIVQSEPNQKIKMSRNKTTLTKEAIELRQELLKIESVSQVRKMDQEEKRLRRLEKNRVSARRARERKKAHWASLENNNKKLKKENTKLKKQISEKEKKISSVNQRFELLEKQMGEQQKQIQQLLQLTQQQQLLQLQQQQQQQQQQEEEQQKQLELQFQINPQQQQQQQEQEKEILKQEDSFQFDSWLKDMISIPDQKLNSYFSTNPNDYGLLVDGNDAYLIDDLDQTSEQTTTNTRKRGFGAFGISLFAILIVFGLFLNFGVWPFNKNPNSNDLSNDLESKHLCSFDSEELNPIADLKLMKEGEKIDNLIKQEILEFKKKIGEDDPNQQQININHNPEIVDIYTQNHKNEKLDEKFQRDHSQNHADGSQANNHLSNEDNDDDFYTFNFGDD